MVRTTRRCEAHARPQAKGHPFRRVHALRHGSLGRQRLSPCPGEACHEAGRRGCLSGRLLATRMRRHRLRKRRASEGMAVARDPKPMPRGSADCPTTPQCCHGCRHDTLESFRIGHNVPFGRRRGTIWRPSPCKPTRRQTPRLPSSPKSGPGRFEMPWAISPRSIASSFTFSTKKGLGCEEISKITGAQPSTRENAPATRTRTTARRSCRNRSARKGGRTVKSHAREGRRHNHTCPDRRRSRHSHGAQRLSRGDGAIRTLPRA